MTISTCLHYAGNNCNENSYENTTTTLLASFKYVVQVEWTLEKGLQILRGLCLAADSKAATQRQKLPAVALLCLNPFPIGYP